MKVRMVSNIHSLPFSLWKFSHGKSYEVKFDDDGDKYVIDDDGWKLYIYFDKEKLVWVGAGFDDYQFAQIV